MKREGAVHLGIILCFAAKSYRIDFPDLTGGKATTLDAHLEMLVHLLAPRLRLGRPSDPRAATTGMDGLDIPASASGFRDASSERGIASRLRAGCDAFPWHRPQSILFDICLARSTPPHTERSARSTTRPGTGGSETAGALVRG
ncbi:MAG: hypothetical protein ACJ79W_04540 [Myxococcales bacterium]